MPGRLQNKVALVTGAGCIGPGWGNGRATAVLFAREGAKVFAVDKNGESMKETLDRVAEFGGTIKTYECDVTQSASVKAMIDACLDEFGRIDVMVNNVGGSAAGGPVELSEEAWDGQMNYNLKSVFLACKHVLPVMERQGGGAIVNLASTSGLRWTGSPQVGYAASKAGVMQLSRVVAVQYANKGIRVNTVVPGQLHTPMVEARLAKQRAGGDVEKLLKTRVERIPAGFMGDGRDTAHAALFLACKHVLPIMERQGGGAIVNLASTSGLRWTGSPQVGYAASKAGVMQLSRVVAVQYANKGIRVNTVVPGQLHTPMVEARLAKQRAGGDVEKLLKTRVERIPAGFMGDGRDTAHAALFLASDEARFVTGTEIIVDGGMVARCD